MCGGRKSGNGTMAVDGKDYFCRTGVGLYRRKLIITHSHHIFVVLERLGEPAEKRVFSSAKWLMRLINSIHSQNRKRFPYFLLRSILSHSLDRRSIGNKRKTAVTVN